MPIKTATNSKTGDRVAFIGGAWRQIQKSATGPGGAKAYFVNGAWFYDSAPAQGAKQPTAAPEAVEAAPAPTILTPTEAAEESVKAGAIRPEFVSAVEANLNAMPKAERDVALKELVQREDATGRAARLIERRYAEYDKTAELPTLRKIADPRLEARTEKFIGADQGLELAQKLAQQEIMEGQPLPRALFGASARPDEVGARAREAAAKQAEELKDAGFVRRVGAEMRGRATQSGLGFIQFFGDVTGQKSLSRRALAAGRVEEAKQEAIPKGESPFEQSAQQAIASFATQAPTLVLGAMTGTAAPVLAQAAIEVFGTEYNQGRRAGLSPGKATTRAALIGGAEIAFERFGLEGQFKVLKESLENVPNDQLAGILAKTFVQELPAEQATSATQFLIDKLPELGLQPDAGWKEFFESQAETLRQTLIQTTATTGAVYGLGKGAEALQERAMVNQMTGRFKALGLPDADARAAAKQSVADAIKAAKAAKAEPKKPEPTAPPPPERVEPALGKVPTVPTEEPALGKLPSEREVERENRIAQVAEILEQRGIRPEDAKSIATRRILEEDAAERNEMEARLADLTQDFVMNGFPPEEAKARAKARLMEVGEYYEQDEIVREPEPVGVRGRTPISLLSAGEGADAGVAEGVERGGMGGVGEAVGDVGRAEGAEPPTLTEAVEAAPAPEVEAPEAPAPEVEAPATAVQTSPPVPGEQSVDKTPDQIKEELKTSAPKTAGKIKLQDNDPTIEAAAVFAPPAEPTLLNRRNAKDIPATERIDGLPISGGTSEGDIVDPEKRRAKFDEVDYTESKPAMTQDLAGAIEATYPAQTLGNIGVLDYGMTTWLGAHFNGGVFVKTNHGEGIKETAPVIGHELGHAAHSLLGDKINKNPRVLEELRAVEGFLYPGLRDKIAAAEKNYDNKFFNYLLSPDELIAEFNVQRLGNPEQAKKVAPILTRLLQSVDNSPGLVKKRKTVPSGLITVLPANGYFALDGMHSMDISTYPIVAQVDYYIRGAEKTKTTKNLKKAIQLLESVKNPDIFDLGTLGDLYSGVYGDEVKNLVKAAEVYARAAERSTAAYIQENFRKKVEATREQIKAKKKYTPSKGVRFVGSGDSFDVEVNGEMTSIQIQKSISSFQPYQVSYRDANNALKVELFSSLNAAKRYADELAQQQSAESKKVEASSAYKRAERRLNKAVKLLGAEDTAERAQAIAQLYALTKAWKGGGAEGIGAKAAARLAESDITDKDRAQAKKDYEAIRAVGKEPRDVEFLSIRGVRGFYSALERAVANAKQEIAPASDWLSIIDKLPGVKKDEIEWSGVREYLQLKGKDKVTRDQLVDYLENNGVEVKEVLHESANDLNREQLLAALDSEYPFDSARHASMSDEQLRLIYQELRIHPRYKKTFLVLPGGKSNYKELLLGLDRSFLDTEENYTADHWGEYSEDLDVLAHVRFNERTDPDGNRVLFVEEIQSDWAQEGRRYGFESPAAPHGVHRGPFVTDTKAWVALTIKRMIRYAIDNGFDKVAFISGEQSVDRYGLEKKISRVEFSDNASGGVGRARMTGEPSAGVFTAYDLDGNITINEYMEPSTVANYIGKELAERLFATTPVEKYSSGIYVRNRSLEGLTLKTGGKGMRDFYDKIVPQVANDVLNKLGGGKVKRSPINIGSETLTQVSFDITDKMRDKVAEGLPLFAPPGGIPAFIVSPPIMDDLTFAQGDLRRLEREYRQGKLTEEEFAIFAQQAKDAVRAARKTKSRARGAANFRAELRRAVQNGDLKPKEVALAEWFIQQNPALLDDLGVEFEESTRNTPAGQYLTAKQVVLLFKRGTARVTIVHEILHHLERMLPENAQAAITKEWMKQFLRARKKAKIPAEKAYFDAVYEYNFSSHKTTDDREAAAQKIIDILVENKLDATPLYPYFNPSEFWANNASDIVAGRYDAIQGGTLQRLKNWLRELVQKLKSAFGMESHGDIIRALDSLAKADGKFQSATMLARRVSPADTVEYKSLGQPPVPPPTKRAAPPPLITEEQRELDERGITAKRKVALSRAGEETAKGLSAMQALREPRLVWPAFNRLYRRLNKKRRSIVLSGVTTDFLTYGAGKEIPEIANTVKLLQEKTGLTQTLLESGGKLTTRMYEVFKKNPTLEPKLANLMYEATIAGYDPADKKLAFRNKDLDDQYKAVGEAGQKLYVELRDYYSDMADYYTQLLDDQIQALRISPESKQLLLLQLRKTYESGERIRPYFPLIRRGQYWLAVGSGAAREFYMFETMGERDAALDELVSKRYPNANLADARAEMLERGKVEIGDSIADLRAKSLMERDGYDPGALLRELFSVIDGQSDTDADVKESLKESLYQLYLQALPEQSYRKQFLGRKFGGRAGFSTDVLRNTSQSIIRMSIQLARVKYAPLLRNSISQARDSIVGREDLLPYVDEMKARVQSELAPPENSAGMAVAKWLNKSAFIYYMSSWSSALLQPLSLFITGWPVLTRYGVARGTKELANTLALWNTLGVFSKDADGVVSLKAPSIEYSSSLSKQERKAVRAMKLRGITQSTYTSALYDYNAAPTEDFDSTKGRISRGIDLAVGGLMHTTERITRELMFLAAFRLNIQAGKKFDEAVDQAVLDTIEALNDYSQHSKPPILKGVPGRIMLQFRMYPIFMTLFLLKNFKEMLPLLNKQGKAEAAKKFFGTLGMTFAFAGTAGLPGFSAVMGLLGWAWKEFGEDDEELPEDMRTLDFETWWRESYIPDLLGEVKFMDKDVADIIERGPLSVFTGLDFSTRLGLNDMWFRDIKETATTRESALAMAAEYGGPSVAMVLTFADAYDALMIGDTQKFAEKMSPALARGLLVAKKYAEEGVKGPKGESLLDPDKITTGELIGQSIGFRPDILADTQQAAFKLYSLEQRIENKRNLIMRRLNFAFQKRNIPEFKRIINEEVNKGFNRDFPTYAITGSSILQSIQAKEEQRARSIAGVPLSKENAVLFVDILRDLDRKLKREEPTVTVTRGKND